MVVGTKVCELTDGFLWFVCGNFDVSPSADALPQTATHVTDLPQTPSPRTPLPTFFLLPDARKETW